MGGPLILMGIDAEDGGPGGHGPITVYESVVNSILSDVTNGGSGILVIGGGKSPTDNVTTFWNTLSADIGVPVKYVNRAAIATQSFSGFAMLAVVSSVPQTPSGGLTNVENLLLNTRQTDIADFINSGGGFLGFTQTGLTTRFAYLERVGTFTTTSGLDYYNIAPTPAGLAVGITNALDVCEVFDTFPSFLQILATDNLSGDLGFGKPAAIGRARVAVPIVPVRGILLF